MKNILIVDDNKFVLDAISLNFSCLMQDCNIVNAHNGKQAIETTEAMHIDFILTDIEMPVIDGYQLIEYMKNSRQSIPVAAMTGSCTPDVVERLHALGVSFYVEKPFDFTEVIHRITEALELVPVLQ